MRLCALCDVGFDMNLGKISAKLWRVNLDAGFFCRGNKQRG
jgi:hypothetical protein